MLHNWIHHAAHAAHAFHDKKNPKLSAVMLIIIGVFLTPCLVGIPLVLLGLYKLSQ